MLVVHNLQLTAFPIKPMVMVGKDCKEASWKCQLSSVVLSPPLTL